MEKHEIALRQFVDACQVVMGRVLDSPLDVAVGETDRLLSSLEAPKLPIAELVVDRALRQVTKAYSWRYQQRFPNAFLASEPNSTRSIVNLLSAFKSGEKSPGVSARGGSLLAVRAVELIHSEFSNSSLTLSVVSDRLCVSRWHLAHVLRKETGDTFVVHLARARIDAAKFLLATTERSIKEIAFDVGYLRTASLDRQFRSGVGVTPSEFRAGRRRGGTARK
jgi:AraC-like DNA-binding protein